MSNNTKEPILQYFVDAPLLTFPNFIYLLQEARKNAKV